MNMRIMCNGAVRFAATVTCLTVFFVGDVQAATKAARTVPVNITETSVPTDISETCFTVRGDAGPLNRGNHPLNYNDARISGTSRVFVAVGTGNDAGKVLAPATFTLHDVAPRTGGVEIYLQITDANSPQVSVDFLVCNP